MNIYNHNTIIIIKSIQINIKIFKYAIQLKNNTMVVNDSWDPHCRVRHRCWRRVGAIKGLL